MACGTPVLAEANSMMEELIQPGVNGALGAERQRARSGDPGTTNIQITIMGASGEAKTQTHVPPATLPGSIGAALQEQATYF